jgi:hypothetical protein
MPQDGPERDGARRSHPFLRHDAVAPPSFAHKAAERFVAGEVEEEVAELEEDVDAARAEVIAELRAIGERLQQLEARL